MEGKTSVEKDIKYLRYLTGNAIFKYFQYFAVLSVEITKREVLDYFEENQKYFYMKGKYFTWFS